MNYDEDFFYHRFSFYADEELIAEYFLFFDCMEKVLTWEGDRGPVLSDVFSAGFSAVKDEMAQRFLALKAPAAAPPKPTE